MAFRIFLAGAICLGIFGASFEAQAAASGYHRAALWARVAHSSSWTDATLKVIEARLRDFEQARDRDLFCPGYSRATPAQKRICWLRLVGGVVEFESGFRPDEPPFREPDGSYSVGLLALTAGECPAAPTVKALMNPVRNLLCGVDRMAKLIAKGGAIDNPGFTGASGYWSTLRPKHKAWDPHLKRWLVLGKKDQIIARTRTFRSFY